MSLQMRLLAAFPGLAGHPGRFTQNPQPSVPVPHELYQVNHVVRDTVDTQDGEVVVHSLVPATDDPRDTPLDICIYVHGGGYLNGLSTRHWRFISDIAGAGMKVVVPDYGLAPEFEAGAAARLLDVLLDRAVTESLASGLRVTLAADSAGAGLALGWFLDRLDRLDSGDGSIALDWIDRIALICPWLDATCSSPGTDDLVDADPWLHPDDLRSAGEAWGRDAGVRSVLVSPLTASDALLSALPPVHVWSGTRDFLHADATELSRRTGCALTVADGALHNYPLLSVPEGKAARGEVIDWIADEADGGADT